MGLFKRKPKTSIEDACRQFYDFQIFHAVIAGEDVSKGILDTMFDSVVEADQSFAKIERTLFYQEMCALRLELFGLAWGHKFKQEKFAIQQSIFTRHYLDESGKLEMWAIMGEYNQAVADSVTLKATGERMEDWQVVQANKAKVDMFDKWTEANKGATTELDNCVARVANRIGADISRNDSILTKRLAARLADRLGCDVNLNTEAIFRLSALVYGLYNGAREAIKSVNLQA